MSEILLFPDNTVLCNFASVSRVDLLRDYFGDRGRWTASVHFETANSRSYWPDLSTALDGDWMGDPIDVENAEVVERIRRAVFGGNSRKPREHLGEAETCHLLHSSPEYSDAIWMTDDGAAYDYGERLRLLTWDTTRVMSELVARGDLIGQAAFELIEKMLDQGRNLRKPPERWQDLVI